MPVRDAAGTFAVVDVLFEADRLVIEVDGWAAHGSREALERDRRRQSRMTNAGYRVLRFTWQDLQQRPGAVLAEVRAALGRLGRSRQARRSPSVDLAGDPDRPFVQQAAILLTARAPGAGCPK